MQASPPPSPIRVAQTPSGTLTYLVDLAPETLPPVRRRDLEAAWTAARDAALGSAWDKVRLFRFRRTDGGSTDLALADPDACCWAGAVDRLASLASSYGLSLCLRLLALIDLLARSRWAHGLCRIGPQGAKLDPALLRVAAQAELNAEARFDEAGFRVRLAALPSHPLQARGALA